MNVTIERFHDDNGGSATTGELDTNADGDALLLTAANIKGRIQIQAAWLDVLGRLEDLVEYGTNAGATFDRDGLSVPARSATALRTTLDYDDTGEQFSMVDPKGIERRSEFDDMGRQVAVIENYEDGTPETLETDKDLIIRHGYINGLRTTYTADLPGTDQVTTYYYGTTKGTSAGESAIATTNLLHQVANSDTAGSTDRMSDAYNALGQGIWRKDQDGTVLERIFDLSGRLVSDVASTLGTGIDGAVRRKEFAYDGLGRMSTATQYDATTSGTVLDQRTMAFGAWGLESSYSLDVDSTVSGGSGIGAYVCSIVHAPSWAAQAPATRSGVRRVLPYSFTLPTGYNFVYRQGGAGYHEEAARTNAVTYNNVTTLATFEFVGAARVSSVTLQAENFVMDHSGASSGSYPGWDDFNRQKRDQWVKAPGGINKTFLDREYRLDEGGFITGIYDHIEEDADGHHRFDSLVTLDGLNRITGLQRGELNGGGTTIAYESMDQQRTFDLVGNVTARTLDWNADDMYGGANEYSNALTHNAVNEITMIGSDSLTWSGAGALTDDWIEQEYVYDAWGRMVSILNQSSAVIANYRRDALDHLIGEQIDREPDSDVDSSDWWEYMVTRPGDMGMLASFKGSDPDALVERMWLGDLNWRPMGGLNAPAVLETRDDDADGALDRGTVLFLDCTGSVIANYGDESGNGKQLERIHYDVAGVPFLIPWGDADADGEAGSEDLDQIDTWWNDPIYDVRGDLDLDGDVDSDDYYGFVTSSSGGVDAMSQDENTLGADALHANAGVCAGPLKSRILSQGIWSTRHSSGYMHGANLYTLPSGSDGSGPSTLRASAAQSLFHSTNGGKGAPGGGTPTTDETCQGGQPGVTGGFESLPPIGKEHFPPDQEVRQAQSPRANSAHGGYFVTVLNFTSSNNDADNAPCGERPCQWQVVWQVIVFYYSHPGADRQFADPNSKQYEEWHGDGTWPRTTSSGKPSGNISNVTPSTNQSNSSQPTGSATIEAACSGSGSCTEFSVNIDGAPEGGQSADFSLRFCCTCYISIDL